MKFNKIKQKKKQPPKNRGFFGFVDDSMARTAKVVNSKEGKTIWKELKPMIKDSEKNRHQEVMSGNAGGPLGNIFGNIGSLGNLFKDIPGLGGSGSPFLDLLSNPFVLGGIAAFGSIVAIKVIPLFL